MLKPRVASPNHEQVFLERYRRLRLSALQLVQNDVQLAEDLLHDVFVQFALRQPNLNAIENLDAYLRTMLRNMHLSQLRRSSRMREATRPLLDYDSATNGLETLKQQTQIHARDELTKICEYALLRKNTSKAASVLILRFFHAYYPTEIAQILRRSRNLVDQELRTARTEAKAYLADPDSLAFISEHPQTEPTVFDAAESAEDVLLALRNFIFRAPAGDCPSGSDLKALFRPPAGDGPDCRTLAHIVSCRACLDVVNETLGLPLISARDPEQTLRRDARSEKKSGGGGSGGLPPGSGGTGGGDEMESFVNRHRRQVKEVFEHHPKELRISVNGFIVGAHSVNSEVSKQTLTVNLEERICFVEVFSERDVRLLFCGVEPPPDGPGTYNDIMRLSEGRTLELNLAFAESHPQIDVTYQDPTYRVVPDAQSESSAIGQITSSSISNEYRPRRLPGLAGRLGLLLNSLRSGVTPQVWLRPATVTTLLAAILLVAATLVYWHVPGPKPTAAALLREATSIEELEAARTDQILHRTISLEERGVGQAVSLSNPGDIRRSRIEIWQSAEKGITARRLYDEHGQLVAGDWRRRDGVQTLYHHRSRPQLQLLPEKRAAGQLSFSDVWLQDVSAKGFSQLIGNPEGGGVEELPTAYRISYTADNNSELVGATLLLSRADLRAIEETLVIRRGSDVREYHFKEATFERHSPSAVAPRVFEPEQELLGSEAETRRLGDAETNNSTPDTLNPAPVIATAELEVEVLRLLSQAGADMGEQISVARTPEGKLHVRGLVETTERKNEILRNLSPVATNAAVSIDIKTVAEALKQQPKNRPSGAVTVENVQSGDNVNSAQMELRRYFAAKDPSRADEQARRFADQMVYRSSLAMRHAWALKRLLNQFSADQLRTLAPESRAKWLTLIRTHAREFEQETKLLRQQLQSIFGVGSLDASDEINVLDDQTLASAVTRLFALGSSNDAVIRSTFMSTESGTASGIKSAQFWRSLKSAEAQAAKISGQ